MKPLAVFLFIDAALTAVLHLGSRKKYAGFIASHDTGQYPLKFLFPAALWLLDLVKYSFGTNYDRLLMSKLTQLYGHRNVRQRLKLHWAAKITYTNLGIQFLALMALGSRVDAAFAVFCAGVLTAVLYLCDWKINSAIKKRQAEIQMEFPCFLNKIVLLVNAGMTFSRAWEKAVVESSKYGSLYRELRITLSDIKSGKPEQQAYVDFAARCRTHEVIRFVSAVVQNIKKGGADMVTILRLLARECWESRKNTARRLGEEASTKLLLPMVIMFLAILIIVVTPAILALGSMGG